MPENEREQYKRIIQDLQEANKKLQEENAYLKFELEQLKGKVYKKRGGKDNPPPPAGAPPKKRGGLFGHTGWFRKKPEKIDRIEEVRLQSCPDCGSESITECNNKKIDEHIQEDIILPRVEAVLYRHHEYYCPHCKKVVSGVGKNELLNSYIGPKAKALAAFFRYGIKISERDTKALFEKVFNLNIVASSITGFRYQLKRAGSSLYQTLQESLKKGSFIHADETGWGVDGKPGWLWKYSNKKICFSHIDASRGQKVVEKILGQKYNGTLITDFLSAYNKIITLFKQRCLVHIIRDLKKVEEYWHEDAEVLEYVRRLRKIFDDAIALCDEYKDREWDDSYCRRRQALKESLKDFGFPNPNKKILKRFAKRLNRHKDELLTFLYVKDIDFHNNHAEQQIRPDVIFRKITFGNRSWKGAEYHSVIMSILQTARLNKIDPIGTFEDLLLKKKQYPLLTALSPPG